MSQVVNYLKGIRARIEQGWTKGAYARDARDEPCDALDREACCWCLSGAMFAEVPRGLDRATVWGLLGDATPPQAVVGNFDDPRQHPVKFNDADSTTQADVLALVDRAILLAQRTRL